MFTAKLTNLRTLSFAIMMAAMLMVGTMVPQPAQAQTQSVAELRALLDDLMARLVALQEQRSVDETQNTAGASMATSTSTTTDEQVDGSADIKGKVFSVTDQVRPYIKGWTTNVDTVDLYLIRNGTTTYAATDLEVRSDARWAHRVSQRLENDSYTAVLRANGRVIHEFDFIITEGDAPDVPQLATCTLAASTSTVPAGVSVTLSWNTTNGVRAWLSKGIGDVPLNGSYTVTPTETTGYRLSVLNEASDKTVCWTVVKVVSATTTVSQLPSASTAPLTVSDTTSHRAALLEQIQELMAILLSLMAQMDSPKAVSESSSKIGQTTSMYQGNFTVTQTDTDYSGNTTLEITSPRGNSAFPVSDERSYFTLNWEAKNVPPGAELVTEIKAITLFSGGIYGGAVGGPLPSGDSVGTSRKYYGPQTTSPGEYKIRLKVRECHLQGCSVNPDFPGQEEDVAIYATSDWLYFTIGDESEELQKKHDGLNESTQGVTISDIEPSNETVLADKSVEWSWDLSGVSADGDYLTCAKVESYETGKTFMVLSPYCEEIERGTQTRTRTFSKRLFPEGKYRLRVSVLDEDDGSGKDRRELAVRTGDWFAVTHEDVTVVDVERPVAVFDGYINGYPFAHLNDVTQEEAFRRCTEYAANKPNGGVRCEWDGHIIFNTEGPQVDGFWGLDYNDHVYIVGAYQGTLPDGESRGFRQHPQGNVTLTMNKQAGQSLDTMLVLTSYEPIKWQLEGDAVDYVSRVFLSGYYDQEIVGITPDTEVIHQSHQSGDSEYFYAHDKYSDDFEQLQNYLEEQTQSSREFYMYSGRYEQEQVTLGQKG